MTPTIERRRASQYSPSAGQARPQVYQKPDGGFAFSGYVVKWDSPSEDLGGYVEIIRRGAFATVLASGKPIVAILDHEKRVCNVLGSTASGTLTIFEDDVGLSFIARTGNTQAARDAAEVIHNNPIGVSFAFVAGKQRRTAQPDGSILREIIEAEILEEISLVVDAAYKSSTVSVVEMGKTRQRPALPAERSNATPSIDFLRRQMNQAELEFRCGLTATRDNPHHDEAGKFHDGSPTNLLAASRGRLAKAMARHDRAQDAYRQKDGPGQWQDLQDAKVVLQAAVDGGETCGADVQRMHEARCSDHRAMVDASRRKFAQLVAQAAGAP